MLILAGKAGQKITIGDDIEITFLGTEHHKGYYRLGITAPIQIPIIRETAKVKYKKDDLMTSV